MPSDKSISVVVPALNEAPYLAPAIQRITTVVAGHFDDYEVIIIDDGSTDQTGAIAEALREKDSHIVVVHHDRPQCLGGAFRKGLSLARMTYVTAVHGKGGTTAEALAAIWSRAGEADMVIPYILNAHERHWARRVISLCFRVLVNVLFRRKVRYYLHHVLFRRRDLEGITIRTDSYAFQAEAIVKLLQRGHTYVEVGVCDEFGEGGQTRSYRPRNVWGVVKFLCSTVYDIYVGSCRRRRASHSAACAAGETKT